MTLRNREVKSKFHSRKILVITDFDDMDEAREWCEKMEKEAKLPKNQQMIRIFNNGFH
jgi:hypothetical protein